MTDEFNMLTGKDTITPKEINELTAAVGWGKRKEEKWAWLLDVSSEIAYVRDKNNMLVAFGRILEDGVMCMFYDILVHPGYQKLGLGTKIMSHLIDKVKDKGYVSIGLFVWEDNLTSENFYKKFGFEKVETGMELKKFMVPEKSANS